MTPLAGCGTPPPSGPSPGAQSPTPSPPGPGGEPTPTPTATPAHPFGLQLPSTVEAVIFDGAFGVTHAQQAAAILRQNYDGLQVVVRRSTDISADVAARFADGATPPDLINNAGANRLGVADLIDALLPLDDLITTPGMDGEVIGERLYSGVLEAGTFNGRLVALNYALGVYGLWYSASHFASQGWTVPTAWDEFLELGERARAQGQSLLIWGDEAADYYAELVIASAIKEGGHEVRRALDNLEPEAWSHPAITGVLQALALCIEYGFVQHGGSYLTAQSDWARDGRALFYPSGSWIARETLQQVAEGFEMTVAPVPTLTAAPTLPAEAVHAQPTEQYLVPANAANPAGGLGMLRVLLSQEVADEFARTNLVPTVVRGSLPTDADSTVLAAQTRLLADAGEDVFSWRFISHYGLAGDYNRLWSQFLSGELGALALTEELQALSDAIREDPAVEKYTVE